MANFEKTQYGEGSLRLGNNEAESGTLTAAVDVERGTVLVRDSGKKWKVADAAAVVAGAGLGVAIATVEAGTDVPCDVCVSGRLNRELLKVDGAALTDEQSDILRGQGILALSVTEIGE